MKLPIDTTGMTFMCGAAPEPVREFDTKRPKADENGEPVYSVQLVTMAAGAGSDIIVVKVAGEPKGVHQGVFVKVTGLVASPWSMADRSGVSFRATRIEAAPATTAQKAS
ncbi:MAG TPA: hypothetical protein VFO65_03075 [Acidimicrobiales bacterium]|nr:hypothetical protein [Acidimicrobiales bacterium]